MALSAELQAVRGSMVTAKIAAWIERDTGMAALSFPVDEQVGAHVRGLHGVTDGALWLPVGERRDEPVKAMRAGPVGWSWGWSSGPYLTIAGSAYTPPELGPSFDQPYEFGPTGGPNRMDALALVAPVYHSGVTVSGVAYRVLQHAAPVSCAAVIAAEDAAEDAGLIAPDARITCHGCRVWATREHVDGGHHVPGGYARMSDADILREVGMAQEADDVDEHLGGTF